MRGSSKRVTCRHMLMYDSDDSFSDPDEAIDNYYEMLAAYDDSEATHVSDIENIVSRPPMNFSNTTVYTFAVDEDGNTILF